MNSQHLHSSKTLTRELIFSAQFHTCAIADRDITFYRADLDYACDGKCIKAPSSTCQLDFSANFIPREIIPVLNFMLLSNFILISEFFTDPRIPPDHKITLHFGDTNQPNDHRLHFQSPMVKLEPLNSVAKYNSLERFDDGKYPTISFVQLHIFR